MRRLRCRWPFEPWSCSCCGQLVEGSAPSSVLAGLACDDCLEAGRKGEPYIPLTVGTTRPAKPDERPIVAVSMTRGAGALEHGEAFDLDGLVERVRERKPGELGRRGGKLRAKLPDRLPAAIVVTDDALGLCAFLDASAAADSEFWQWQVSVRAGGAWRPEATRPARGFLFARPVRFGYASRRGERKRAKGGALWWQLIDPGAFCELPEGWTGRELADLMRFGVELRDWSNAQQLPTLATVSSYGGRLLRDGRFGAGWRRKVPASTNRRLRDRLPGNHYQLLGRPHTTYRNVHKWDQHSAHHWAALNSRFPHSDLLDAAGWFRRDPPRAGAAFTDRGPIRAGTDRWRELLRRPGMFVVAVKVPELVTIDPLALPQLRRPGASWQTMTHAELDHARAIPGVKLLDLYCCWTSPEDDDRLREYAYWSHEKLDRAPAGRRQWLKPLLLSTYGMLAARPARFRNAWKWTARPEGMVGWATRHGQLIGFERVGRTEREPQTANVLWRAIIESQVRLESLAMAQRVRRAGLRPIAVYADAVFASGRGRLEAPAPWRYEGMVHDLVFETPARYRSREETRLPGTPRAGGRLTRALPTTDSREGVTHGN